MKVFLIRHGSTEYNEKGLMQGDLDIPLSNLGIKQAQKVKEQINKKNIVPHQDKCNSKTVKLLKVCPDKS